MERTQPQRLDPEETQQVLRRAAQLDRQHAPASPVRSLADEPRIDADELERIALLVVMAIGLSAGLAPQHALALLLVVAAWALSTLGISRSLARQRVRKLQRALERVLGQIGG